jgi:hypothetical protein
MRKDDRIAKAGLADLMRAIEQEAEIFFLAAVHEPIACVGARVERLDEPHVAVDANQQHRAVDAAIATLHVGHMMVARPDPGPRVFDDKSPISGAHGA